jgi:hypothetical protein
MPLLIIYYLSKPYQKPRLLVVVLPDIGDNIAYTDGLHFCCEEVSDLSIRDMIGNYLGYVPDFDRMNRDKAHMLDISMVLLFIGIVLTGFAVIPIFWADSTTESQKGQFTCRQLDSSGTIEISNNTMMDLSNVDDESRLMLCIENIVGSSS